MALLAAALERQEAAQAAQAAEMRRLQDVCEALSSALSRCAPRECARVFGVCSSIDPGTDIDYTDRFGVGKSMVDGKGVLNGAPAKRGSSGC